MGDQLRHWQVAFRLGRAGLRLDSKAHVPAQAGGGIVIAWYKHPHALVVGAKIEATYAQVGRR